jgi:hypothetical protein
VIPKRPKIGLYFEEHKQIGHVLNKQYTGRDNIFFYLALGTG